MIRTLVRHIGGGGRNSPFEHGMTSTGSPSYWSGHVFFHFIICIPSLLIVLPPAASR